MTHTQWILAGATLLAALAMWLMLPRGNSAGRAAGAVIGLVSLGLFVSRVPMVGDWASASVLYTLAAVTVIAATAAVTFRSPVYCAIWFALSLLGTAGLFLFQGAQFLGVATIVVYAGAILVTFLFVLMLAQPEGHAFYDRISWEALLSATAGALMVGVLTATLVSVLDRAEGTPLGPSPASDGERSVKVLSENHMAHLGAELFSRHLVSVEIAGTLLLVALVGTVAIVAHAHAPAARRKGTGHG